MTVSCAILTTFNFRRFRHHSFDTIAISSAQKRFEFFIQILHFLRKFVWKKAALNTFNAIKFENFGAVKICN